MHLYYYLSTGTRTFTLDTKVLVLELRLKYLFLYLRTEYFKNIQDVCVYLCTCVAYVIYACMHLCMHLCICVHTGVYRCIYLCIRVCEREKTELNGYFVLGLHWRFFTPHKVIIF